MLEEAAEAPVGFGVTAGDRKGLWADIGPSLLLLIVLCIEAKGKLG
jgi:hypothetical protein